MNYPIHSNPQPVGSSKQFPVATALIAVVAIIALLCCVTCFAGVYYAAIFGGSWEKEKLVRQVINDPTITSSNTIKQHLESIDPNKCEINAQKKLEYKRIHNDEVLAIDVTGRNGKKGTIYYHTETHDVFFNNGNFNNYIGRLKNK